MEGVLLCLDVIVPYPQILAGDTQEMYYPPNNNKISTLKEII